MSIKENKNTGKNDTALTIADYKSQLINIMTIYLTNRELNSKLMQKQIICSVILNRFYFTRFSPPPPDFRYLPYTLANRRK